MSQLQNAAKDIVLPFVKGEFPYLEDDQRGIFAAWAAMVVMNLEGYDPETAVITQEQRDEVRKNLRAPSNWYIGIATYSDERFYSYFYHRALKSLVPELPFQGQRTVFALGEIAVFAHSCSNAIGFEQMVGDTDQYGAMVEMRTIWPHHRGCPKASMHPITDSELKALISHGSNPSFVGTPDSVRPMIGS
jgi:hypothetical protein